MTTHNTHSPADLKATHDLGAGWYASMWRNGAMTLRDTEGGRVINLTADETKRLREIMTDTPADWWQPA